MTRPRSVYAGCAALCVIVLVVLGVLIGHGSTPLDRFDEAGRDLTALAAPHAWLLTTLRVVEVAFGTIGMIIIVAFVAAWLAFKRQPRAAAYVVAVMLVTSLCTWGLKLWWGRARPEWQVPVNVSESFAYPSGHSSGAAAFAGVLIILSAMFLRRAGLRRTAIAGALGWWLLVCADRLLLGRHFPTDVIGGSALGVAVVLLGLIVWDPRPRSHARAAEPLVETVPGDRNLHVVLNPIKVEDSGQFEAIVTELALESGWTEPTWHYTEPDDSGTGMAEAASVAGADLVLVCGGDGTVREVCAELASTGIPVGIIPAGTGNLLARNLGIPLYLRSAIDVALTGQDRAIDLVRVNGDGMAEGSFLVMAGMGFDAAIMEGVNEDFKRRVGWLAYVWSGLKALMFPAAKVEVLIDDQPPTTHRARTIVVGNVGYLQAGMPLLPEAAIDDGLLDVVVLHPRRFLSWIPLALRVIAKGQRTDQTIMRMTGRRITIRSNSEMPRQLDGDPIGAGREMTMECLPGRLLVRVPR